MGLNLANMVRVISSGVRVRVGVVGPRVLEAVGVALAVNVAVPAAMSVRFTVGVIVGVSVLVFVRTTAIFGVIVAGRRVLLGPRRGVLVGKRTAVNVAVAVALRFGVTTNVAIGAGGLVML